MSSSPVGLVKRATGWSIAWSVLLIIAGILSIALPLESAIAVNIILAWLIIVGGVAHLIYAFHSKGAGAFIWKLLVGLLYIVGGAYLLTHPLIGILSLTLVLAAIFFVEGIFEVVGYFNLRGVAGSGWMLFDGIVTIILACLIWAHWPSTSAWVIGTLVGISLIVSGVTRLMVSTAVRGAVTRMAA
ncbi:MAG TPA: DUF308 domain-containing protein [Terriglobales bacterium]|nr:DUF308 domain-containing protein [Terriglobales bacterium]